MKVALYARVSTKRQEKEGTIASQIDVLNQYALENNFEIAPEYICKDEGYSGSILARPALDKLRDGAQLNAFDAVLVLSTDRLSRKYAYLILILEEFERFGTKVIFYDQPPTDDPHSALMIQIQGAVAEYERAKISERHRRGKIYRARQGEVFWHSVPYGYKRISRQDGVPAHVVINEADADVVRKIFSWHAYEGMSIRQITKRLDKEGYPTPKGGPYWGETTVHRILGRESYLGTLYYNQSGLTTASADSENPYKKIRFKKPESEWIPVSIPVIIDQDTFERSKAQHTPNQQFSPRNLKDEHWLLRRLLRCEKCGLKCACVTDKKNRISRYYYRCEKQGPVWWRDRCQRTHIRAEPLDDLVWYEVKNHLLNPKLLLKAQTGLTDLRLLDKSVIGTQILNAKKRLALVQTEKRRLIDAYQSGLIEKPDFSERIEKVSLRISSLENDLSVLEEDGQKTIEEAQLYNCISKFSSTVTDRLDSMAFHERQLLVRTVLDEVTVKDNVVKLHFKIPLPPIEEKSLNKASLTLNNTTSSRSFLRSHHNNGMEMWVKFFRTSSECVDTHYYAWHTFLQTDSLP